MHTTLFEELLLLSIHEEKGTVIAPVANRLVYGLAGAVLAELALQGKLHIGEKGRLELVDTTPTGDDILDNTLAHLKASEGTHKVTFWVRFFSERPKRFRQQLASRLVEKGIVTQEDTRLTWVIPYGESPDQNGSAKYWVKNRLRALVLACAQPDLRDLALLGLVQACGLLSLVFTKDERKTASRRRYELMIGQALNNPIAQTVEEIAAAVESLVGSD